LFQTKNDVPVEIFRQVAQERPGLCFVLGYCDANDGTYGSYLLRQGKVEEFELPQERVNAYALDENGELDDSFEGWEPIDEVVRYWDGEGIVILQPA
jgi:hypothetical protein